MDCVRCADCCPDGMQSLSEYRVDASYICTAAGIIRALSTIPAIIGVLVAVFSFNGASGWFMFVGISYIVYVIVIFIIEFFIPGVHAHGLVDGVFTAIYTLMWLIAAVVITTYAACNKSGKLGIVAAMGFLCCIMCIIIAILTLRNWFMNGRVREGRPAFIM